MGCPGDLVIARAAFQPSPRSGLTWGWPFPTARGVGRCAVLVV